MTLTNIEIVSDFGSCINLLVVISRPLISPSEDSSPGAFYHYGIDKPMTCTSGELEQCNVTHLQFGFNVRG